MIISISVYSKLLVYFSHYHAVGWSKKNLNIKKYSNYGESFDIVSKPCLTSRILKLSTWFFLKALTCLGFNGLACMGIKKILAYEGLCQACVFWLFF